MYRAYVLYRRFDALMSAFGAQADIANCAAHVCFLTQSGHHGFQGSALSGLLMGLRRPANLRVCHARLLVVISAPYRQNRYGKSTEYSKQTGAVGEKSKIFAHKFHSSVSCVFDQLLKVGAVVKLIGHRISFNQYDAVLCRKTAASKANAFSLLSAIR